VVRAVTWGYSSAREALVEAVYLNEVARLRNSADELLASSVPDVALRMWMDCFADYVAAKRGMAETLRAVVASGAITSSVTRDGLTATIQSAGRRSRGRNGPR
jgi:hypothetical protein